MFDHMSFRFDDADEDTLRDLSFAFRRGQTTAIVGSTGSGKSTVAKLLQRFPRCHQGAPFAWTASICASFLGEIRGRIAYIATEGVAVLGHRGKQSALWQRGI